MASSPSIARHNMEPPDNNPSLQFPTSFTFIPTQLQILQDSLADVRNLDNKKARQRMIKQVRKRVLDLEVFTLTHLFRPDSGRTVPDTCVTRIQIFLVKMRVFVRSLSGHNSGHFPAG